MVKNLVGPPVVGEDFVGRKEELAEAVRMIHQGNSLLLASPRRVGKSSFSKKLVEMFRREGVLAAAQLLLNYLCQPNHKSERSHLETIISPACEQMEDAGKVYAELRQMLDNDGYLMESSQGGIVFRSPIIRQYWYNKFVK